MSGTASAQMLPILASPVIARLYSPAELGVFTAISALAAGIFTVSTWRYDVAIVAPPDDTEARGLVSISRRLSYVTCLVFGLVLVCFSGQVSSLLNIPDMRLELAAVGFLAWSMAQVQILNNWCTRRKRFGLIGSTRLLQAASTTGTQLGVGIWGWGAQGLITSLLVGYVVGAFRLWRQTRDDLASVRRTGLRKVFAEHRKMPAMNLPNAMLDTVRLNGTQLMIQVLFSSAALGQFGQAWRFLQAPAALINSSFSQVFYQKLSVIPPGRMRATVRRSIVVSAAIGVLPFTLIYLFSPMVFPVVFGARWEIAGYIGSALTPWLYLNFISSPISFLFIVVRRQGLLLLYAFPLTAAPLLVIAVFHTDIVQTVAYVSWTMAAMLAGMLLLALMVAKGFDSSPSSGFNPGE